MADTAFMTVYRNEFVLQFEQQISVVRNTVVTEAEVRGTTAVFLVAGSGVTAATAVTRGVNGLIPARADNLVQNSCTIVEWHDLV